MRSNLFKYSPSTEPTYHDCLILIAAQDKIKQFVTSNILSTYSINVLSSNNDKETQQFINTCSFDLIFMDLEFLKSPYKLINKSHALNLTTPLIAITNHTKLIERREIIAKGFDECLNKPIKTEQLNEIIALWLEPTAKHNPNSSVSYAQQLLNKTLNNQDLALTILEKLLQELPLQLRHIEQALSTQNYKQALDITHQLHGNVCFCGLLDIQQPALRLEQALLENDQSTAEIEFTNLNHATAKFTLAKSLIFAEISNNLTSI